jgi:perosamine synthetase
MVRKIPIARPMVSKQDVRVTSAVLRSRMLAQGSITAEFERKFAGYIGVNDAVALCNGTAALDAALKSVGITDGDEVATTAFSFIASANAILYQRARPVFVDIKRDTFDIDPDDLRAKISKRTKAVLGVHLFGQPFDVAEIQEICHDNHLLLIEDCAQAHGAEYEGKKVGGFGVGCFSFYPTKNMTTGEGGMLTTDGADVASFVRLIRDHGQSDKYCHTILGYNYRMTDVEAAMGIAQLGKLDSMNATRIRNAQYLNRHLDLEGMQVPRPARGTMHVYNQYVVALRRDTIDRERFASYLAANGIGSAIHYPMPIYQQPLYKRLGYSKEAAHCPVAEETARSVLSLPVHPALTPDELGYVVSVINGFGGPS